MSQGGYPMQRRHELTDEQWKKLELLLPGKASDPGRTATDNRQFVNAVLFVLKTGIPWADLPARYGKPNTVWKRFDRWCANGVWERIFRELGEEELIEEMAEVHLDSSIIKAHQTASSGRRQPGEKKVKQTNDVASEEAGED
jgi:putative transposase